MVESLGLSICAPSFEMAKHDIRLALGKHIEALLAEYSSRMSSRLVAVVADTA
jgi:hypothetical protein